MQRLIFTRKQHPNPQLLQRGAGLVEVLVAMVILAVGLLGVAGMTAASIQHNQTARMRGTGVLLVNDLAERARINIAGFDCDPAPDKDGKNCGYRKVDAYSFNSSIDDTSSVCEYEPNSPPSSADIFSTKIKALKCTPANLATYDKNQWLKNVRARLPGGSAYITTNTKDKIRTMDVALIWTEPSDLENNLTEDCPDGSLPKNMDDDAKNPIRCMNFRVTL